jgi:hypothetical protein
MRRTLTILALAAVVALVTAAPQAWAQEDAEDLRRSTGNLRPDSPTGGRAIQGSNRGQSAPGPSVVIPPPAYYAYPRYRRYPGYYRYYPRGSYGYYPYYGVPYGYRSYRYGYRPPIFLPAETLYGPRAMRRFMGIR